MKLIDTHAHLDLDAFDDDREAILTRCQQLGIHHIVIPGIHAASWSRLREICAQHPGLHPAYGLHPVYLAQHRTDDVAALAAAIQQHHPIAVGEIGLDFYLPELDRHRQQALFDEQLAVAAAAGLPVLLHVRKAHDAVLQALRKTPVVGGICHAFNGSLQQARQYLDLGFKLGFGGTLTYPRAHKLHRLAQQLPLEAMVLETDAPDMPVASHHGQRNSPEYLPEILRALAQLREQLPAEVAAQTTSNAEAVLDLSGGLA